MTFAVVSPNKEVLEGCEGKKMRKATGHGTDVLRDLAKTGGHKDFVLLRGATGIRTGFGPSTGSLSPTKDDVE